MTNPNFLWMISGMSILLGGCGLNTLTSVPEPQSYSLNGVKFLSPTISAESDPTTYLQSRYVISDQSRLLVRFEELSDKVSEVSLTNGNAVSIEIELESSSDLAAAQSSLTLCPVLKNWMMLATWYRAHPMGNSGIWSAAGADFDHQQCVSVTSVAGQVLKFDVTSWFQNEVRGLGRNYGLILISSLSRNIRIFGDADSSHSPKIKWVKN